MTPPRIFISYSHDSAEHKDWVLDFATTLRNGGVDAVLDQWDLKPGDDLPHFMETQLETADYILMICTKNYVEKANAGAGGVGYEKMIMTSSLLPKIDNNKVIPIIHQNGTAERPTFLKSKYYIDFSNKEDSEDSLAELLRHLLDTPLLEKPEIGSNPFKPLKKSKPDRVSDGVEEVMRILAKGLNNSTKEVINLEGILKDAGIDRLTFDKYLSKAIKDGLIKKYLGYRFSVTDKGIEYLISHKIIEA